MINWKFYNQEIDGDIIFTDGSRFENKVGCAFVHFRDGIEVESRKIRLSDGAAVFIAEVVAIKEVVEYIQEKDMRNVRVISDSRFALMALDSPTENRRIINSIKERIKGNIVLYWVKANQGIRGNEQADTIARELKRHKGIEYFFSKSCLQIRKKGKLKILKRWQERWESSRNGKWTRRFFVKVNFYKVMRNVL
ncbi:hypothetical protein AVEN_258732-1 [Araneus ventricosus]|uniref:RNase H type-1 domain-containing protein n=2 Tax=Araneus ventricosus TaxID=182803 RepID=A0A4Y2N873_ARAVE|nr:hypothetical protein AVEN_258732-1 [Araneus ventricosus]